MTRTRQQEGEVDLCFGGLDIVRDITMTIYHGNLSNDTPAASADRAA